MKIFIEPSFEQVTTSAIIHHDELVDVDAERERDDRVPTSCIIEWTEVIAPGCTLVGLTQHVE